MKAELANLSGIPIKDRDPNLIRAALADKGDKVADAFVKLHKYAVDNRIGISAIGQQAHIPSGTLSQCFNAVYPGDYDAIADRIATFFWRLDQKEKYGGMRQFVETRLAKSLWTVFEKTRIVRRIQFVESPEQLGKTRAAVEYTERNNTGRTICVKISGGGRDGYSAFIWNMAEILDLPSSIRLQEKRLRIQQKLATCDLIIIDEAHLIWGWPVNSIRDFWDYLRTDIYADGERGVVLIATNSDMMRNLGRFRRQSGYNIGQLLGRMRNEVIKIDPAESIIEDDVALMMSRYYKPGKEAVRCLHNLAIKDQLGHFGLVNDVMNEAWTRAKAKRKDLSDEIVTATANEILENLNERENLFGK